MIDNRAESQPPISQIVPETGLRHEPASVMRSFRDNSRRLRLCDCRSLPSHTQTCHHDAVNTLVTSNRFRHPPLSLTRSRPIPNRTRRHMDNKIQESPNGSRTPLNTPYPLLQPLTILVRASTTLSPTASSNLTSPASPTPSPPMATTKKPTTAPSPTLPHRTVPPQSCNGNTAPTPFPATAH